VALGIVVSTLATTGALAAWTVRTDGTVSVAVAEPEVTLSGGAVDALHPGAARTVDVALHNGGAVAYSVTAVTADVTSRSDGCSASVLSVAALPPLPSADPTTTVAVPVEVSMADSAEAACQGATFDIVVHVDGRFG
jgi:hypothetical protein